MDPDRHRYTSSLVLPLFWSAVVGGMSIAAIAAGQWPIAVGMSAIFLGGLTWIGLSVTVDAERTVEVRGLIRRRRFPVHRVQVVERWPTSVVFRLDRARVVLWPLDDEDLDSLVARLRELNPSIRRGGLTRRTALPDLAPAFRDTGSSADLSGMDGRSLAVALATRLQEVVPADYLVQARDGVVRTSRRDGTGGGAGTGVADIVDQSGDRLRFLLAACDSTLDLAQDVVVKDSKELWPGTVPTAPRVEARGGQIHLRYGTDSETVLELRPIDIGG
jgi:hypothetical protein